MKSTLGVLLGAMLPAALASAQIQYKIDGPNPRGPLPFPADGIVDVGSLTTGTTTLHIYDSSGVDESIVGQVRVVGTATSGATLRVKVVNQSDTVTFTGQPTRDIDVGLRDFGGLTFQSDSLRDQAVVAIAITGNITGDIDAGQVWRIDVRSDAPNTFGGHIYGNITAHKPDNAVIAGAPSIGYVRASNGIGPHALTGGTADIRAIGEEDALGRITARANISRVIIGPNIAPTPAPFDAGLQGSILAEDGSIGAVFTTGPIGNQTTGLIANIWAGDGIGEIRAMDEVAPGGASNAVLPVDFLVSVESNKMMTRVDPSAYNWSSPLSDGVLGRLETGGSILADIMIRAGNIGCNPNQGGTPDPACVQPGIYVGGVCHATIDVQWDVLHGNLIAQSFPKPIRIGRFLKGAVVATGGPLDVGTIGEILVGYTGEGLQPTELVPGMDSRYSDLGVGLCGIDAPPFDETPMDTWYTNTGRDLGAIDGVVRAAGSIGTCAVRVMGDEYSLLGGSTFDCKDYAPRIEAPTIGVLRIDDFRAGTVWSGNLSPVTYDDYYTDIGGLGAAGNVSIGCMGPHANIWMKDWFLQPPDTQVGFAEFSHHVLGNIHVPDVGTNGVIRIGDELGDVNKPPFSVGGALQDATSECWPFLGTVPTSLCSPTDTFEQSPRNPHFPDSACTNVKRGKVWISESQGLQGQVIVNGEAAPYAPAAQWSGEVDIGLATIDPTCPGKIIARDSVSPYKAPLYATSSPVLGGGAVGLVPYTLYATDCVPPHYNDWNYAYDTTHWPTCADEVLLSSRFNGPVNGHPQQSATIRFYGPIRTDAPFDAPDADQPYTIWYYIASNPLIVWADVTAAFDVSMSRPNSIASYSREVVLTKRASVPAPLHEGFYAVVFNTQPRVDGEGPYPIYCDATLQTPPPAPANNLGVQVEYHFRLYPDCDADGCINPTDVRCPRAEGDCVADLDDDGLLSNGGHPDGGVDINDLLFFLYTFEAGFVAADLDDGSGTSTPDGGVDVNDLLFFLTHFELGC